MHCLRVEKRNEGIGHKNFKKVAFANPFNKKGIIHTLMFMKNITVISSVALAPRRKN
jgi:hypothetical protein